MAHSHLPVFLLYLQSLAVEAQLDVAQRADALVANKIEVTLKRADKTKTNRMSTPLGFKNNDEFAWHSKKINTVDDRKIKRLPIFPAFIWNAHALVDIHSDLLKRA